MVNNSNKEAAKMLTEPKLFKNYDFPSWYMTKGGTAYKIIESVATNWILYLQEVFKASKEGTGYIVETYVKTGGIKKVKFPKQLTFKEAA